MIESIEFKNFKVLKDAKLPLGPFTLIVGANGSGKSTALQAIRMVHEFNQYSYSMVAHVEAFAEAKPAVEVGLQWGSPYNLFLKIKWESSGLPTPTWGSENGTPFMVKAQAECNRFRVYTLDPRSLPQPVQLTPNLEFSAEEPSLAGFLDRLRDSEPERFEALNEELGRLLPEFDRILFETPKAGHRSFSLRTRNGHHRIPAIDLSQGTLLALALLAIAYQPNPPPLIGLEEPDRGIHPRLLRQVRDALYRLSYPDSFGESREPVQVVATTQSPYFLDEFSDHPEEIVIAEKVGLEAKFSRLMDHPHMEEVLEGTSSLGEVWYTGVLGGVPARS